MVNVIERPCVVNKYRRGEEFTRDLDITVKQTALVAAKKRLSISADLFELDEIDVLYDEDEATLWSFMRPDHERRGDWRHLFGLP